MTTHIMATLSWVQRGHVKQRRRRRLALHETSTEEELRSAARVKFFTISCWTLSENKFSIGCLANKPTLCSNWLLMAQNFTRCLLTRCAAENSELARLANEALLRILIISLIYSLCQLCSSMLKPSSAAAAWGDSKSIVALRYWAPQGATFRRQTFNKWRQTFEDRRLKTQGFDMDKRRTLKVVENCFPKEEDDHQVMAHYQPPTGVATRQ